MPSSENATVKLALVSHLVDYKVDLKHIPVLTHVGELSEAIYP